LDFETIVGLPRVITRIIIGGRQESQSEWGGVKTEVDIGTMHFKEGEGAHELKNTGSLLWQLEKTRKQILS
jgi:hypothetical protein